MQHNASRTPERKNRWNIPFSQAEEGRDNNRGGMVEEIRCLWAGKFPGLRSACSKTNICVVCSYNIVAYCIALKTGMTRCFATGGGVLVGPMLRIASLCVKNYEAKMYKS